jgi:hypothetical protein
MIEAREIRRLQRRFVKTGKNEPQSHAFWVRQAIEKKRRAEAVKTARKEARHNQVTMLRKYRDGEVGVSNMHRCRIRFSLFYLIHTLGFPLVFAIKRIW